MALSNWRAKGEWIREKLRLWEGFLFEEWKLLLCNLRILIIVVLRGPKGGGVCYVVKDSNTGKRVSGVHL